MAIEAARTALDRAAIEPPSIGAVWVGTESKPYAVKPSATIVAEALGITPHTVAADMEFACKAGSEAMQAAVAFVGSGMVEAALAIGMDTAQSKPGDALEYTAGCGGAAYLFAPAEQALAVVEASVSHVTDTPDFFRREAAHYPEHGAGSPASPRTSATPWRRRGGCSPRWGSRRVTSPMPCSTSRSPKFVEKVAAELGFSREQYRTGLVAPRMGNAYAGSSLLGLAAVLDVAMPGDRVFFCSYGSGAGSDAFCFRVTGRIEESRQGATVLDYLERRRLVDGYGQYLRLRGKIRRA